MKQLRIEIFSDGKVWAQTKGIRGKACRDYVKVLEQLTGARAVDSEYTPEYRLQDNVPELSVTDALEAGYDSRS